MHLLAMDWCPDACLAWLALHTGKFWSQTFAHHHSRMCKGELNLRLATAVASVSADSRKSVEGTAGAPREGVSESPSTPVVPPSAVAESSVSVLPACTKATVQPLRSHVLTCQEPARAWQSPRAGLSCWLHSAGGSRVCQLHSG